ncbi:MAG: zinc-ribbon domain-containing protein, partial [Bacillota bacterium]|nr:zinc-ribbon domain-containing protein [Bacillota bacterium]
MFCKHCGSQIADDAIFCSHCGTKLIEDAAPDPAVSAPAEPESVQQNAEPQSMAAPARMPAASASVEAAQEPEVPRKPFLEGMSFDVSEYPDNRVVEKTEDIDFNWNLDPDDIPELRVKIAREAQQRQAAPAKEPETSRVSEIFDRVVPAQEARNAVPTDAASEAAGKVGQVAQLNTFNEKNAAFQKLLDRELAKVRDAGTIGREQVAADEAASRRFASREEEMTMDDFLEREGIVKRYEPQEIQSDLLDRIDALEKKKAQQREEEEARMKALEEARAEALVKKRKEREQRNAELEARAAAAEEIRQAEQAQIQRMTEQDVKKKAEQDAARLEALARKKAEEEARAAMEQRRLTAEAARQKAEEARAKVEAEARVKAEAEARRQAEEQARLEAEAELKAAEEAARIRAQREAAMAAREEAALKAAQERRRREAEIARLKAEAEAKQKARARSSAAIVDQAQEVRAQTAKMREEEEKKIRAALAGIRGGRFSDTLSTTVKKETEPAAAPESEEQTMKIPEPVIEPVQPVEEILVQSVEAAPV